jgi:hypothetical protein
MTNTRGFCGDIRHPVCRRICCRDRRGNHRAGIVPSVAAVLIQFVGRDRRLVPAVCTHAPNLRRFHDLEVPIALICSSLLFAQRERVFLTSAADGFALEGQRRRMV